jgi:hypothetical protein
VASQVDRTGTVLVKSSRKTEGSIVAKAIRPSILVNNPSFSIEHVRDTFRFKAVVFSFHDAVEFILAMHEDRHSSAQSLCPITKSNPKGGLSAHNIAKLDVAKLKSPKEWGWRFLAFDFIVSSIYLAYISTIQRVEYQA